MVGRSKRTLRGWPWRPSRASPGDHVTPRGDSHKHATPPSAPSRAPHRAEPEAQPPAWTRVPGAPSQLCGFSWPPSKIPARWKPLRFPTSLSLCLEHPSPPLGPADSCRHVTVCSAVTSSVQPHIQIPSSHGVRLTLEGWSPAPFIPPAPAPWHPPCLSCAASRQSPPRNKRGLGPNPGVILTWPPALGSHLLKGELQHPCCSGDED